MSFCTFPGCGRKMHGKGLCGAHYQQLNYGSGELRPISGDIPGPDTIHRDGWVPPSTLSPAWHASMQRRSQPAAPRERPCGLEACAGVAQHGSDLCPAHHHWRAAQQALKAKGLA
jgi:hypothetical protein